MEPDTKDTKESKLYYPNIMLKVLRRLGGSKTGKKVSHPVIEEVPPKEQMISESASEPSTSEQRTNHETIRCSSDFKVPEDADALEEPTEPPAKIMITGGGIVGLLMALALDKHVGVKAEVYEQTEHFDPDVGAGMGLYANGLRVIQDVDPALLKAIQMAGHPYIYRRWERHDGTEVAVSDETVLGSRHDEEDRAQGGLQTMGIRRWKLQQCLHAALQKAGIPIYFGKEVASVSTPENGTTEVLFKDGSKRQTQLLIGADGGRSAVRTSLLANSQTLKNKQQQGDDEEKPPKLNYTGVTCIMGVAENIDNIRKGISLPVSNTTECHGAFYPTGGNEQCFQFHFPVVDKKNKNYQGNTCGKRGEVNNGVKEDSCWGNLSQQVSREECAKLAAILEADGWDEDKYLKPLREVTKAVRVGFCQLTPALKHWSFPNAQGQPGTVLIGDAAHPAVPYIGQGAQQGMEDVGTLALLLKAFCVDDQGNFDLLNLDYVVRVYEKLRLPHVDEILTLARHAGKCQLKRAQNPAYNIIKEEKIQRDVFFHETNPVMFAGARYDYKEALEEELKQMEKQHDTPPLRSIAE